MHARLTIFVAESILMWAVLLLWWVVEGAAGGRGQQALGCEHIDPATESYVAKIKEAHFFRSFLKFLFVRRCRVFRDKKGASKKGRISEHTAILWRFQGSSALE